MALKSKSFRNNQKSLFKNLVMAAKNRHGKIYPCGPNQNLLACMTELDENTTCLWYNTEDGSTHVVTNNGMKV